MAVSRDTWPSSDSADSSSPTPSPSGAGGNGSANGGAQKRPAPQPDPGRGARHATEKGKEKPKGKAEGSAPDPEVRLERGDMPQCFTSQGLSPSSSSTAGAVPNGDAPAAAASSAAGERRRFRILAYGDSLTAGYWDGGDRFSPYGAALAKALPKELEAEVWVCGLSGGTTVHLVKRLQSNRIRDAADRMGKGLHRILSEHGHFDLVLIMAGTNDLPNAGVGRTGIFTSIQALHDACHEYKLRTVALSMPPNWQSGGDGPPVSKKMTAADYKGRWQHVNERLWEWASGPGARQGVALFVDTSELVPFTEPSPWWEEDGLHFSAAGSRRLGEGLAPLLAPVLASLPPPPAPAPKKRLPRATAPMPEVIRPPASLAASAAKGAPELRILAYGDSLTAGCYGNCNLFIPYSESLVEALLPDVLVEAHVCGLSGLTAEEMVDGVDSASLEDVVGRKGQGLRKILAERGRFDLALIMAGTNDLADRPEPEDVVDNVVTLHKVCHKAGIPTVALSVPPSRASQKSQPYRKLRGEANRLLSDWCARPPKPGCAGVKRFVDTERLMPYDSESGLWEVDGLHFSRAGSLYLGAQLAPLLRPLLLGGTSAAGAAVNGAAMPAVCATPIADEAV